MPIRRLKTKEMKKTCGGGGRPVNVVDQTWEELPPASHPVTRAANTTTNPRGTRGGSRGGTRR